MKILIKLVTASELISYEAVSLAMTCATFDHHVQLYCSNDVFALVMQADNRIHGMIKSLDLYDIPPMWLDVSKPSTVFSNVASSAEWLEDDIKEQVVFVHDLQTINQNFDTVLTF